MANVVLITGLTILMCAIIGMILLVVAQIAYVKAIKKHYDNIFHGEETKRD